MKRLFSFPLYAIYASALPWESRSSEICVEINRKREKTSPTLSIVTWIKISIFLIFLAEIFLSQLAIK